MEDKNNLILKRDRYKSIATGCAFVFAFALVSFIISINTVSKEKLQLVDIAYIFVMAISLVILIVSAIISNKTNKKIKNMQE